MSDTRRMAKQFLIRKFGDVPGGILVTSRYYYPEISWTKSPAWWIQIPIDKLQNPKHNEVNLLLHTNDENFYFIRVPTSFFLENLSNFDIVNDKVTLFPSARSSDMFVDLRGPGKIDFSGWLQE